MKSNNRRTTAQIEMVETYNISLSLRRLNDLRNNYDDTAQRRAIYHAVVMTHTLTNDDQRKALREALKLP